MRPDHAIYSAALPLAAAGARIAALFNGKIAEGISGRRGLKERWARAASRIERGRTLLWFHVSSVGEFLQARPVIDLLAARHPDRIRVALTFFSPSGMNFLRRHDGAPPSPAIVFADYLPLDTPANARLCIGALRPSMMVYVKFDLWPNLIAEAHRSGVPQVLVSGTLSPGSWRLSPVARGFYRSLYERLDAIAAITGEDAARFARGLPDPSRVIVAGDTRFDQVCARIDAPVSKLPPAVFSGRRPLLIAGSTWPKDEAVVIPGFARLRAEEPEAGLIVAPHEPTAQRLEEIGRALERHGLPSVRLSALDGAPAGAPVIVADGVGYLAELYRAGALAYIGGSRTTGVHNVMEPAVAGLPVLFGPKIDNSWEAGRLVGLGAGRIVRTPEEFARAAAGLLRDEAERARLGRLGSGFIRSGCGAASRCADLIERLLGIERA
ncbi:MAG: glycosyltransferase N-terminal domain-containing protein [Candidatus Krumholzibacteria bacterium]|nr:glycosyltransferase N-terminal domain-containing protein [Candidatus Krumholzibacteria bacterium]